MLKLRTMRTSFLISLLFLLSTTARAEAPMIDKKTIGQFTLDALKSAYEELGSLPSHERKIFETEATKESQSFVSNYRGGGETTDVQIDKDKLQNYLHFTAAIFSAARTAAPEPRICLSVRVPVDCPSCEQLREPVSAAFKARLAQRGFVPKPGPEIVTGSEFSGDSAFEELLTRSAESGCDGSAYVELKPDRGSGAEDETDDVSVRGTFYVALKDLSGRRVKATSMGAVQVPRRMNGDVVGRQAASDLLSRGLPDLYSMAAGRAQSGVTNKLSLATGAERYVRLEGIGSFEVYSQFKQTALATMPELRLEERFISPGVIQFAVPSGLNLQETGLKLKRLSWGEKTLEIVKSSREEVVLVLR